MLQHVQAFPCNFKFDIRLGSSDYRGDIHSGDQIALILKDFPVHVLHLGDIGFSFVFSACLDCYFSKIYAFGNLSKNSLNLSDNRRAGKSLRQGAYLFLVCHSPGAGLVNVVICWIFELYDEFTSVIVGKKREAHLGSDKDEACHEKRGDYEHEQKRSPAKKHD